MNNIRVFFSNKSEWGEYNKGSILFDGSFDESRNYNIKDIIVGNYTCQFFTKYEHKATVICRPDIVILPPLILNIKTCFIASFQFQLEEEFGLINIPINQELENNEKIRFEYMINHGIDISKIKFMKYEVFIQKIFEKIALIIGDSTVIDNK